MFSRKIHLKIHVTIRRLEEHKIKNSNANLLHWRKTEALESHRAVTNIFEIL